MKAGSEISLALSDEQLILAVSGSGRDVVSCRKAGLGGDALRRAVRLVANIEAPLSVLAKWYGGGISLGQMPEMYAIVRDCAASPATVMALTRRCGNPELVSSAYLAWRDGYLPLDATASNALDWIIEISSGTTGASIGGVVDYYFDFIVEVAGLLGGDFPSHRFLRIVRELFPGDGIHQAFRKYANDAQALVDIIRTRPHFEGLRIQVDEEELTEMGVNPCE